MNPEKDTPTNTPTQGNSQVAGANLSNKSSQSSVKNSSATPNIKDDLLSNQLANEPTLREESFSGNVPKQVLETSPKTAKHRSLWRNLLVPAAAILILLALGFGGYAAWRNANQQAKDASVAERFGSTTFDLNNLGPNGTNTNPGLVVIHGNEVVNGSVTADSFSGNGSGLTGVNAEFLDSQPGSFYQDASNLDSGTLNDARLSGNVVLLGDSPSFGNLTVSGSSNLLGPVTIQNILLATGAVTFQSTLNVAGDVTIGGDTNINGLSYAWPDLQGNGVLSNDGSGNLAWQPVGACATCLTDGGNAFGTSISVGTNDANSLMLKTNGNTQLTIDTTGQVGVGLSPGYKLDVNGDVNVSAGNAFRIGGTAICTSGGCAASAGSTDYVQNSASLQTGVNFNFEIASVNSVGGIIRAKAGQVSDLQQWQSSGGIALAYVDAAGDFSANSALKINGTTVCTISGCTAAGGSGVYIQNGTALQTTANFNIQSAAAGSVGGVIRGAVGQTASLLQLQNSGGTSVASFGASGGTILGATTSGAGSLQVYATPGSSLLAVRDSANSNAVVFGVHITGDQGVLTIGAAAHDYLNGATRISGVSGLSSYFNNGAALGVGTATVAGTVQRFGVYGYTTVDNAAASIFATGGAANKGIVVQGAASQSANLQEWQNSSGTQIAAIDASGRFVATTLGSADTTTYLCRNSTNQIASCSGSSSGAAFVQGGNSFGATATLGTNDANGLAFETNNTVRVTVPSGTDGFTFGAAGDTNLYRLAAGTLATDSILSVRDATDTYVNINPNGTITLAETLGPTSATLDYSHLGFSDSTSYVQIGSSTATTGALRLANNSSIAWRNAANSANVEMRVDSSNSLLMPGTVVVGGSDATAGTLGFFNTSVKIARTAVSGLAFYTNSGNLRAELNASGAFGLNRSSGFTSGTVEKFSVNNPTTVDNAANAIFVSSATTSKPLVIQGVASQTASLLELQSSTGASVFKVGPGGGVSIGTNPALTGSLNLPNNADIRWRNAANSADLGMKLTVSDNIQFATNIEIGLAQPSTTGALRLQNNDNIGWRNAANSGNYTLGVNSSNVLTFSGSDFAFGSTPSTLSGALRLPNLTLVSWRNAANSGNVWLGPNASSDDTLYYSGTSITLAGGTNTASSGALRLQNNTSVAWRNAANSGNIGLAVNSGDNLTTGAAALILGNGGTPASSGALRLNNNTNVAWRNAGNTGDITAGVNASDIFQVTSPAADGSTVAQFNNAGATNCTVQPGGTGFACSSDERLKTNIMNLESGDATELVNKLQGVSFNWITSPDGQTQVGFVAQDLMKYIPSAVSKDSNGYYVANYSAIIPYLVEAFKKQQTQIDTLRNTPTGTSVDVLKTLADAKAVTLSGDLTVGGNVVVKGHVGVGKDTAGTAVLPAGQTKVHIGFSSAYKTVPKVTASARDFLSPGSQYRITGITAGGFDIEVSEAQSGNTTFDWQALAVNP